MYRSGRSVPLMPDSLMGLPDTPCIHVASLAESWKILALPFAKYSWLAYTFDVALILPSTSSL